VGTLAGVRIIEMAGIGPGPFCGMLLADMGAEVLRIDRIAPSDLGMPLPSKFDLLNRNKRSVAVDLKTPGGREAVMRLIAGADALIEGFRPGVMERLGLGPDACAHHNPRLVYGRMTGWGQEGPLSQSASHDINYISLTGALNAIGRAGDAPVIPLNLVGDFGGGALYLAMGILAALLSVRSTGLGQVIDASICDGVANLMTMHFGYRQAGQWSIKRGANLTDGGAPFYDVYETRDGLFISVGAVEHKFYVELLSRIGLRHDDLHAQNDANGWSRLRARLAEAFKTRTRDEWCQLLQGTDACFAPVLDMDECVRHPHNVSRNVYIDVDGVTNPAPAPRFSRTPSAIRKGPSVPGGDTDAALLDWQFSQGEIAALKASGAIC
jgi:alpha-methylacyl-CoA racemase